jgi:hypothetical protein
MINRRRVVAEGRGTHLSPAEAPSAISRLAPTRVEDRTLLAKLREQQVPGDPVPRANPGEKQGLLVALQEKHEDLVPRHRGMERLGPKPGNFVV